MPGTAGGPGSSARLRASLPFGPERPEPQPSSDPTRRARAAPTTTACNAIPAPSSGNTTYAIPKGGVTPATAASFVPGRRTTAILPSTRTFCRGCDTTIPRSPSIRASAIASACMPTGPMRSARFCSRARHPPDRCWCPPPMRFCCAAGYGPTTETVNYTFGNDLGPYSRRRGQVRSMSKARSG